MQSTQYPAAGVMTIHIYPQYCMHVAAHEKRLLLSTVDLCKYFSVRVIYNLSLLLSTCLHLLVHLHFGIARLSYFILYDPRFA